MQDNIFGLKGMLECADGVTTIGKVPDHLD